jgi:hypothetical protein
MNGYPFVDQPAIPESIQRAVNTQEQNALAYMEKLYRPTIQVRDLEDQQYQWLGGTTTWSIGNNTPSAAARNSSIVVEQAVSGSISGKIIRIRQLIFSQVNAGVAQGISWGIFAPGLAPARANSAPLLGGPRDSRFASRASLVRADFCTTLINFISGGYFLMPPVALANPIVIPVDFTFTDNTAGFFITTSAVNQQFNCTIVWDEREATKMELNR